ncbi:uncharacterized protein LOC132164261 [Corylus avellana]|uniref:uncharacterized protein LOC132164261 n=1 Tax=Corylus avellana TaxID=13451 RepID=UPI00286A1DEC|nr:uncharacterized protein LOC132164261 [Corylus avellana]
MEWQRRRPRSINKPLIIYCLSIFFFFFLSFCALFSNISSSTPTCQGGTCPLSANADVHFQEFEKRREEERWMRLGRRFLSGPGSSPPRCLFKCGKCTPCKPVHVPVPPGTPVTSEYYPEAWRCKCGNKLYMP